VFIVSDLRGTPFQQVAQALATPRLAARAFVF
jgi:hypothetical protein